LKDTQGEIVYRSSCKMCHGGCGVLVHVRDGEIVKVEGDPDSPMNKGRLCPKGLASLEHIYNPERLLHPLKRKGGRGEGRWERISWDEALDDIAAELGRIRREYGPEAIALGTGTGRHHYHFVIRFANALGTPNWCEPGTAQCFIPRLNISIITYGDFLVCDYFGDTKPACILVWGHNPLLTGPDGEVQFTLRDALKSGSRLIVVDPRLTETAKRADVWLQLRPGSDDALALSLINALIDEELYDSDFVERWTSGFRELSERVEAYTPEWAEEITWIPARRIREAARMFAMAKPASLDWGVAFEHTPNCFQTGRAVAMLPALTGNIDIPGGWIYSGHPMNIFPYLADNLGSEMKEKRLGADSYKVLSGPDALFPSAHIPTLFEAMRTGRPYPIKAFLIFGNNALATYANPREVHESLMELDLLVVTDIYMTPTAELADIVLPAATWLEVDQVQGFPIVADFMALAQQKLARVGEARQDEEIMIDLARRMNLGVGTESLSEVLNYQLDPLGIDFEELKKRGCIFPPIEYRKYEKIGAFLTPSGKVELKSSLIEGLGYDPLPYYQEPPESPISTPELLEEYPYILITGGRVPYFFHSEHRQIPSLRNRHPHPLVQMHPDTADRHGISEGDWVWIESRRGRIRQRAAITEGIDPRVVHVEHGWWFPEEEGPEHGIWRSNANLLTDSGPPYDPAMGTYQLRALLCKIYKEDSYEERGS